MSGFSDIGRSLTTSALGELRAADQPEMQRERKPKCADPEQPERRPGDNLNRPVPTEPPYLVT